jgi:hypothetical protein
MASDTIKVFNGTLTATEAFVQDNAVDYTPGTGRKLIIQGIFISNSNAVLKYALVKIAGIRFIPQHYIPSADCLTKSGLEIPLAATQKIAVKGEVASDMDFYIWGVECDA